MGFVEDFHNFITGSPDIGKYPATQWNQWNSVLGSVQGEAARQGITYPSNGSPTPSTATQVGGHFSDILAQISDRWKCADGGYRNLPEIIEQVRIVTKALKDGTANQAPSQPSTPSTPTKPPTGSRPKPEWQDSLVVGADVRKCGFKSTDWNTENGGSWPPPIENVDGKPAIRFRLPNDGKRIEVEPNHRTFSGGEAYFGFSFKLDSSFPSERDTWQLIWQLHGNDTDSPQMAIEVRKGQISCGEKKRFPLSPISKNVWNHVVIRINFDRGDQQTWLNGKDLGTKTVGKNPTPYYLKVGFYHDRTAPGGTVWQRNYALGKSYAEVDPSPR